MDKNEFFREATFRICSNLQIEKAMVSFLQYIQDYIPANRLFLEYYDKNEKAMRTIVDATPEKGKSVDLITPLSNEARDFFKKKYVDGTPPPYYYENPHEVPVARELLDFHKQKAESVLVLPFGSATSPIGIVTLISITTQYHEKHLKLITLLKEPFQIAMSNALKHRNELRLFDRDFFFEVTQRICGNLEIKEGLKACIDYLSQYMPVDYLYLGKYEEDLGTNRVIARASSDKAEEMDLLLPVSEKTKIAMSTFYKEWLEGKLPPVFVVNNPREEITTRNIMDILDLPYCSTMNLFLVVQDKLIGNLILCADGDDRFDEHHSKIFATLRIPFFVAMSNTLRHRNELRLFNRDFFFEMTGRICGNLEIEKGLRDCINYLSQHMPVDFLLLLKYERENRTNRLIASASPNKCNKMDFLVPATKESKEAMSRFYKIWKEGKLPPVIVVNKPKEEPVTRNHMEVLGLPPCSNMSLPLIVQGEYTGNLILFAEGDDRFTDEHARLYATLKKPFFVAMSNALKHEEVVKLNDRLADDNRQLQRDLLRISGDEIIGADFGLKEVMHKVKQVAPIDSPVLLLGETGTGKDVIANKVHYSSSRCDGPFVSVNCGAIPDSLIDSELFGHEKGAFTGALSQKRGRFERANKGTIFLDEIGELPLQAQVRLLKVLQSKEIERVGGTETIKLNIRVIAATNRNLQSMVYEKQFREDLWFRLNVFPIWIPPLRQRKSDIPALLQHFIVKKTKELNLPCIPRSAKSSIDTLMEYNWPGNVRELENIVERAIILSPSGPLTFDYMNEPHKNEMAEALGRESESLTLDGVISHHIRRVLSKTGGKVHGKDGAAELLGINASTLRNRMNKLGIEYGSTKGM